MATEIYAHDWEKIGSEERIPRWPSAIGERRGLRVEISTWLGISIGAKHWYVKVEEQNNSWWSESQNAWVELSCDSGRTGYTLKAEVMTTAEAVSVADSFIALVTGGKSTHAIEWDGPGDPRKRKPTKKRKARSST